ncbi:SDR family mycofactocin-dependent oxidoreductase [Kribbella sp. VKM Ac-2527]|uniref:SDR family mycofactocin-dependent oxidoreductase n=1 Tax=Kribbella caucasensis TaxID=2512215 RepID=A0A4R6KQ82_9ACTN|nr:mycofactocin-coupled SDR family oxidoreductase [Kribbella sp. VKM Ac-2527]TDO51789.1 SDR family mycofactocin-dependent oxidoreductase [Kribbella sp. VKM Ac-2527]
MTGRVEGKVAFVTGAARGQGRAHAVRLAAEGADIIAVDLCAPIDSVPYALATEADLKETVRQVDGLGRRIVSSQADVRDFSALEAALAHGVAELGRLDIVVANAGILSAAPTEAMPEQSWQDMIDVNLTGVYHAAKAAIPHIKAGGAGGSIVLTSSALGIRAMPNLPHYVAAKTGVVGLMRALALELAADKIRVNTVNPSIADTLMVQNEAVYKLFVPHIESPTREQAADVFASMNPMPIPWVDAEDVANAVMFLVSDDGRFVTGLELKIDAGFCLA